MYLLSAFVAEIQNLSVLDLHFEEFTILSLTEFINGEKEMLLCPSRAVKHYTNHTRQ